jgi:hypothetical protein
MATRHRTEAAVAANIRAAQVRLTTTTRRLAEVVRTRTSRATKTRADPTRRLGSSGVRQGLDPSHDREQRGLERGRLRLRSPLRNGLLDRGNEKKVRIIFIIEIKSSIYNFPLLTFDLKIEKRKAAKTKTRKKRKRRTNIEAKKTKKRRRKKKKARIKIKTRVKVRRRARRNETKRNHHHQSQKIKTRKKNAKRRKRKKKVVKIEIKRTRTKVRTKRRRNRHQIRNPRRRKGARNHVLDQKTAATRRSPHRLADIKSVHDRDQDHATKTSRRIITNRVAAKTKIHRLKNQAAIRKRLRRALS